MTGPIDDEALLARFRQWLDETRDEAERLDASEAGLEPAQADAPQADVPDVGLRRLVEEFTALRHEVKLQTKGTRGLQEQAEGLLAGLQQAIDQFRSIGPREDDAALAACRPLIEALADLDEALDRGRDGAGKARERLAADPLAARLDAYLARQSWFRRRLVRSYHQEVCALVTGHEEGPRAALFAALIEGYDLIHARLRRTLASEQIRRIDCIGQPVDPERMSVVALIDAPDQPPGTVVEEVRRGYTWRGRVFRFAEVRAVRTPTTSSFECEPPHGNDHRD